MANECRYCGGTGKKPVNFSEKIRELRELFRLTQEELAQELGVSRPTLTNLEKGNQGLTVEMLIKIADYFDVTTDEILRP